LSARPDVTYQMMIKPCGPSCNLACQYCYYLSKARMMPRGDRAMDEITLEMFVRQYLGSHGPGTVTFAWQGGEPTLAGLDLFRKAVELQDRYRRPGQMVENTLQTNGTLLDDEWCRFLHEHGFLVGLSVDGPGHLHDVYRRDKRGDPTSALVIRASRLLARHRVDFNTLTVVNRANSRHPLQVYRFLRNVIGSRYMQFIPCVEPKGFEEMPPQGRGIKARPITDGSTDGPEAESSLVTEWSVDPEAYGDFLIAIFDEWFRKDVGRVFVINFEAALGAWMGLPPPTCTLARTCGRSLVIEHDGSVYSCDHYVYPEHRLGNIHRTELIDMVLSERQSRFGQEKALAMPDACKRCRFLFACTGECPRNRFIRAPDGDPGMNYLCPGLRKFLEHISPAMTAMAWGMARGHSARDIARSCTGMRVERRG
jgi:uncharacterized protein